MHTLRPLLVPLHYWRTILIVLCSGLLVAAAFDDQIALLLCTLACAFVFASYERRRWISVSTHSLMGEILFRFCLALCLTYFLAQRTTVS